MGRLNKSRLQESWPKTGTREPGVRHYQNCEKAAPTLMVDAPWRGKLQESMVPTATQTTTG